jgi:hypothetical protein
MLVKLTLSNVVMSISCQVGDNSVCLGVYCVTLYLAKLDELDHKCSDAESIVSENNTICHLLTTYHCGVWMSQLLIEMTSR